MQNVASVNKLRIRSVYHTMRQKKNKKKAPKAPFLLSWMFGQDRKSSMDGRPRPGLSSGEECCKQSDPEQFGCPSVRRSLDVHGKSGTPSTLCTPTSSSFVSPCGLGEGEHKFIFNLVIPRRYRLGTRINITTPASGRGVITESFFFPLCLLCNVCNLLSVVRKNRRTLDC